MINNLVLQFLSDLKANNDRNWFNANKKRYEKAREEFVTFISALIEQIARFDPPILQLEAKKCIFRIYRDTRFSKNKQPYKTNFGAHLIEPHERPHDRAGYYVHIEPGGCFLAGGAYMPPAPWLNAIRESIDSHGEKLVQILNSKNYKKYFDGLQGEQLKTKPRDYPEDHPFIDLLRYKSFISLHEVTDAEVMSENFLQEASEVFKAVKPFDDFLNESLISERLKVNGI